MTHGHDLSRARLVVLTVLALLAFAGNALFCRVALKATAIDPASFTTVRLLSGVVALWLIVRLRNGVSPVAAGSWRSAAALFAYAAPYSYAYGHVTAATGALLVFGAVQVTMIGWGLWTGHRLGARQWVGLAIALLGLAGLLLPGLSAPPLAASVLMIVAGIAWGVYSLRGRGQGDPTLATAGNFLRASLMGLVLSLLTLGSLSLDAAGVGYAVASGALTSGVGYAIWYAALPGLRPASASTVQLSVPVITALGGVLWLAEPITLRVVLTSAAILGGIALVVVSRQPARG